MSKAGRFGLIAVAVAVAIVAFVVARPGGDDGDDGSSAPAAATDERQPTATAPSAPPPPADAPGAPRPVTIQLRGHAPVGGVESIEAKKGDRVRFVVRSDAPDDIHLHGYDLERSAGPGKPAAFSFVADIEGIFEIESHEAEHEGKDALIARLVVEPS